MESIKHVEINLYNCITLIENTIIKREKVFYNVLVKSVLACIGRDFINPLILINYAIVVVIVRL
jgi:hypothetical protein